MGNQVVIRRRDGSDSTGDRHRHCHDVIGQQRSGRDQPRTSAEVFLGDGVGPPTVGVGKDRLPIRESDQHQQADDDSRYRHRVPDCRGGPQNGEDDQNLIRRIGYRGDRVG